MLATREAKRPSVCPEASTTNHLRAMSCPPGKRVTISKLLRNKSTKKDRSMTPLTSIEGRHKAGQLQSSEVLRIPNLAQICQRQHPGKQPGNSASSLYSNSSRRLVETPLLAFLRASAVSFWFSDFRVTAISHGPLPNPRMAIPI